VIAVRQKKADSVKIVHFFGKGSYIKLSRTIH